MKTNIKGIYTAGDLCTYAGKAKLVVTGIGEATMAVNQTKLMLEP